jgi:DNA-binding MarR family transcriptional regulator
MSQVSASADGAAPTDAAPTEAAPTEAALTEAAPTEAAPTEAALTIVRLFRAMERVDSGLTPQQYRVLKLIGAGGERSARLAEKLTIAKPTLTSTADGLVAAGLLAREAETTDRRAVRLRLTEAGQAAMRHADEIYSGWLSELLAKAGDPERLTRDFAALEQAMEEMWLARRAVKSGVGRGKGDV